MLLLSAKEWLMPVLFLAGWCSVWVNKDGVVCVWVFWQSSVQTGGGGGLAPCSLAGTLLKSTPATHSPLFLTFLILLYYIFIRGLGKRIEGKVKTPVLSYCHPCTSLPSFTLCMSSLLTPLLVSLSPYFHTPSPLPPPSPSPHLLPLCASSPPPASLGTPYTHTQ